MKKIILFTLTILLSFNTYSQITDTGNNVGIGIENPDEKLHVAGKIKIENMGQGVSSDSIVTWNPEDSTLSIINSSNLFTLNNLIDCKANNASIFIGSSSGSQEDKRRNTVIGVRSFMNNISGRGNSVLGFASLLENTTGEFNTAIGTNSLCYNTSGNKNTAIGTKSLNYNTNGSNNTAMGAASLFRNTIGNNNIGIGSFTDSYNQEGSNNTIIGYEAGKGTIEHNKSGCVFLGYQAGYNEYRDNMLYIENSSSDTPLIGGDFLNNEIYLNGKVKIQQMEDGSNSNPFVTWNPNDSSLQTSPLNNASFNLSLNDLTNGRSDNSNVFLGDKSGMYNAGLNENTAVGTNALSYNTTGAKNTASGSGSLFYNTTGTNNVGIGTNANCSNYEGSYNTIIGSYAGGGAVKEPAPKALLPKPHNRSGNIFIGYRAGYNEQGSNKLYIENSDSKTPLIGGDFSKDEIYLNGRVGIGTSELGNYKLNIDGNVNLTGDFYRNEELIGLWQQSTENAFFTQRNVSIGTNELENYKLNINGNTNLTGDFYRNEELIGLWQQSAENAFFTQGNVSIGTDMFLEEYKLAVDGKIICEELTVKLSEDWPDYVFESDYNLMSFKDLKSYIEKNKHLPEIPAAKEIKENGISVGEINAKLLQKIEELTLYILELESRVSEIENK
jgi:hypothetical protein